VSIYNICCNEYPPKRILSATDNSARKTRLFPCSAQTRRAQPKLGRQTHCGPRGPIPRGFNDERLAFVTGILALAAPLALAQASTWTSDPQHSEVDFSIKHLTISNVHGRFGKVAATLHLNETDIAKSSVTASIDTNTVDTGEPQRDTHLKSPDFF